MKVIGHAGVDSRIISLDDQARQQMTRHFQLSLQYNISPITGFVSACHCIRNCVYVLKRRNATWLGRIANVHY